MDSSGTSSQIRPIVLVIQQVRELEAMIRSGILSCPTPLEFCQGSHDEVLHHIMFDRPGLIVAPLQMMDMNAADLVQEIAQKTGRSIPGLFISDPLHAAIQARVAELVNCEFVPKDFTMQDLLSRVDRLANLSESTKRETRLESFLSPIERKKSTAA